MNTGIVFDIKEFAVHDGPGIRLTVFLKGCPLSCQWCHNPEGQSSHPQVMHSQGGDRLAGIEYTPDELASIIHQQAAILQANEGGVTFSGGEPLLQARFVAEVIDRLNGVHILLDTSGYGSKENLSLLLSRVNLVYYDLKLVDRQAHKHFTGVSNEPVLRNLKILAASRVPFVIRVPLVPGVTDLNENLRAIAHLVKDLPGLECVHLLTYNCAAGGKYQAAGMIFQPDYDESQQVNANATIFQEVGLKVRVM